MTNVSDIVMKRLKKMNTIRSNRSSMSRLFTIASLILDSNTKTRRRYSYPFLGFSMTMTSPKRLIIRWSASKNSSNNKTVNVVLESRSASRTFSKPWTLIAPDAITTPGSRLPIRDMTSALIKLLGGSVPKVLSPTRLMNLPKNVLNEVTRQIDSPKNLVHFASTSKRGRNASKHAVDKAKALDVYMMNLMRRYRNQLNDRASVGNSWDILMNQPTNSADQKRIKKKVRQLIWHISDSLDVPMSQIIDDMLGLSVHKLHDLFKLSQDMYYGKINEEKFANILEHDYGFDAFPMH